MAIQWHVAALVFLLNSLFCLGMFGIQQLEVRNGTIPPLGTIIPGTKQVLLHWQEWSTLTYGDFLGLILVQVAFIHLWLHGNISHAQKMWLVAITIVAGMGMYVDQSGPLHKPDWIAPIRGELSWAGRVHLVYFGVNEAIGAICIYHWLWSRKLHGKLLVVALTGAVVWIASFGNDIATGRMARLKLEKTETE